MARSQSKMNTIALLALALAQFTSASPNNIRKDATATTGENTPTAYPSPVCPQAPSSGYFFRAADSGTPADGTYLQGVNWQPGVIVQFNAPPTNGHSPQFSDQIYNIDYTSGVLFDSFFPLCIGYDPDDSSANANNFIGTCSVSYFNSTRPGSSTQFAPLVCDLTYNQPLACTVQTNAKTLDTFFVRTYVNSNSQVLVIGTEDDVVALGGKKITLFPVSQYQSGC